MRGVISGTPTTTGSFAFTVAVKDSGSPAQTASVQESIAIGAAGLSVTTTSLAAATNGASYGATLNVSGGTPGYTWSISSGSLPAGLSLSSGGVISGTPTATGTSTFTVAVKDSGSPAQTTSSQESITVSAPLLAITTTALGAGQISATYSGSLSATGGTPGYTWSIASGSLPAGLTMSGGGVISGTPDSYGHIDVYGCGEGQRIARADDIVAGVDHGCAARTEHHDRFAWRSQDWQLIQRVAERNRGNAELHMVDLFGKPADWIDDVEQRCDFGYADSDGQFGVHGCGEGQRIAGADGIVAGVDDGFAGCAGDHGDERWRGAGWELVQRDAERDGWNAELHVVDCVGQLAGRVDTVERRCDFRYADDDRSFDVHGCGERQWITGTDGIVPGVDHGFAGCAGDHDDQSCGRKEWKYIQRAAERDGWNAELHVVDCFGQSAGGLDSVERRSDLRYADGDGKCDVHGGGEG